jgi:hypothetical protein
MIKNLSLELLEVESAKDVLDLFEKHYLNKQSAAEINFMEEEKKEPILIENLALLLLFFKTRLQNMESYKAQQLIDSDYRCKQLLSTTMDRYAHEEGDIEFAYQVSVVYSLAML